MSGEHERAGRRHCPRITGAATTQVLIASIHLVERSETLAIEVDRFLANIRAL
jgi:hypothetical protein